jgi:hypothetical protein
MLQAILACPKAQRYSQQQKGAKIVNVKRGWKFWNVIVPIALGIMGCNSNSEQNLDTPIRSLSVAEFPVAVGTVWTYAVHDNSTGRTDTATVSIVGDAEVANHVAARMWVTTRGSARETTYVAVRGNDITLYENGDVNNPVLLRFPLEVGSSWGTSSDSTAIVGIQTVVTPYATFNQAFEVSRQVVGLNYGLKTHMWIVPRIGLVMLTRDESNFSPPVREVWVLIGRSE